VCWPDQKLVRPPGVAHHSLAAASLGPGLISLSAKGRTGCWLSIETLMLSSAATPWTPTPRRRSGRRGLFWSILTVPADPAGNRQLIAVGRRHDAALWAIEGTGSFGAGLTTALLSCCERIVEVNRPQPPARRGGVKSDDIDAVRARQRSPCVASSRAHNPRASTTPTRHGSSGSQVP
jgi:hypothetical protein